MRVALRPLAAFFGRRDIPVSSFPGRTGGWSSGSSCSFRGRTPPLPRRDQRRCHVRAALPRKGWTSNTAPSGEGPSVCANPSSSAPTAGPNATSVLPRKDPLPSARPFHRRARDTHSAVPSPEGLRLARQPLRRSVRLPSAAHPFLISYPHLTQRFPVPPSCSPPPKYPATIPPQSVGPPLPKGHGGSSIITERDPVSAWISASAKNKNC